jgi:hypothetical protein
MHPCFRYVNERGHIVTVIQKNVYLDSALVTPEVGPWEKGQTQRYRRRIEREQLVLEPKLSFAEDAELARRPETAEKGPEKVPEKFR